MLLLLTMMLLGMVTTIDGADGCTWKVLPTSLSYPIANKNWVTYDVYSWEVCLASCKTTKDCNAAFYEKIGNENRGPCFFYNCGEGCDMEELVANRVTPQKYAGATSYTMAVCEKTKAVIFTDTDFQGGDMTLNTFQTNSTTVCMEYCASIAGADLWALQFNNNCWCKKLANTKKRHQLGSQAGPITTAPTTTTTMPEVIPAGFPAGNYVSLGAVCKTNFKRCKTDRSQCRRRGPKDATGKKGLICDCAGGSKKTGEICVDITKG